MTQVRRCAGYTLIELAVVFVVLGILSGIAIPVISHIANQTRSSVLSQGLDRVAMAEQSFESSYGVFTGYQGDLVASLGSDLSLTQDPSTGANVISVALSSDGYVSLAQQVDSTCNWVLVAPAVLGGAKIVGTLTTVACSAALALPAGSSVRDSSSSAKR